MIGLQTRLAAAGDAAWHAPVLGQRFVKPALYGALVAFGGFWALRLVTMADVVTVPVTPVTQIDWMRHIVVKPVEPIKKVQPKLPPKTLLPPKVQPEAAKPENQPMPFPMPDLVHSLWGSGPGIEGGRGTISDELRKRVAIAPQYPRAALRDGVTGWVEFEVVVNPDGSVKAARVTQAQPRGVFETEAMRAILRWKFEPKVVDGVAVETRGTQKIEFNLEDDK